MDVRAAVAFEVGKPLNKRLSCSATIVRDLITGSSACGSLMPNGLFILNATAGGTSAAWR